MTEINVGVAAPNSFLEHDSTATSVREYIDRAEKLNFHSLWVRDRLLHKDLPILDALSVMAYAIARTSKMKIGSSIVMFPLRNLSSFTKTIASLDFLSSGRIILGLGLGNNPREYETAGIPMAKRVKRFNEGLEVMKELWSGETVNNESEFWKILEGKMMPPTVQKPHPPIWLGGSNDNVARRVVRSADGWIGGSFASAPVYGEIVNKIRGHASESGRDPKTIDLAKLIHIHSSPDAEKSKKFLAEKLTKDYGRPYDVEKFAAYGPAQDCVKTLKQYVAGGAQTLILIPASPDPDQLDIYANEIVPALSQ
jgi:alkanesulfonate monooxygenase SsuD/methylene tetrahydromethanopterin reductase-like flavin-dependent oxidoreductase (luciferase family)